MSRRKLCVCSPLILLSLSLGIAGQGCPPVFEPFPPVVVDTVFVELVNESADPVDPGLFIDGDFFLVDPPLAPGEVVTFEVDCFAGTTLQTDATLLTPFADVLSANVPLVEEGFEYVCGDTVSFIFVDNGLDPFFTRVEVNGFFVTD